MDENEQMQKSNPQNSLKPLLDGADTPSYIKQNIDLADFYEEGGNYTNIHTLDSFEL